jgi:CubicO group peptidase (beta-lactamase class C family)
VDPRRPFARVERGQLTDHDAEDQPCAWWSITKLAIAAAILRLVEDRRLALDDPWRGRPFTLRQLLQHTSGAPDYAFAAYHQAVARGDDPWPDEALLRRADAERLLFAPGEGWRYSNIGYLYLRQTLEAATGSPWGDALADLVLNPLGVEGARAATRLTDLDGVYGAAPGYHPGWVYHGLLVGPARAAAVMLDGLARGRLLGPELTAEMLRLSPIGYRVPDRPVSLPGCGLGMMGETDPAAPSFLGHSGGGPGGHSTVNHYPDLNVTVAVYAREDEMSLGDLQRLRRDLAGR